MVSHAEFYYRYRSVIFYGEKSPIVLDPVLETLEIFGSMSFFFMYRYRNKFYSINSA